MPAETRAVLAAGLNLPVTMHHPSPSSCAALTFLNPKRNQTIRKVAFWFVSISTPNKVELDTEASIGKPPPAQDMSAFEKNFQFYITSHHKLP